MKRHSKIGLWFLAAISFAPIGCESGGVGDPCTPEDEYRADFSGFSVEETNVESRSFQCETRLCLVNHFQGRVSCPYGQILDPNTGDPPASGGCKIPGTEDKIVADVKPQFQKRGASKAVYCSCRCDGPDKNARYCECPSGYSCTPLIDDLKLGSSQLAGSYCIQDGTKYDPTKVGLPCLPGAPKGSAQYCGNNGDNP